MPITQPIKDGRYFKKWLHSGYYSAAAQLECDSCERFWNQKNIRKIMKNSRVGGYVITDLTVPVGYVVFETTKKIRKIYIHNMVVKSDYRRKGIGTMLLNFLFVKKDFDFLGCAVRESNLSAHLFLKNYGFEALQVEHSFFKDEYPAGVEVEDGYYFEYAKNVFSPKIKQLEQTII